MTTRKHAFYGILALVVRCRNQFRHDGGAQQYSSEGIEENQ